MKITVTYDPSNLIAAFGEITANIRAKSPETMRRAVEQFREDCINVPPLCPRRYGGLIEAHRIFVVQEDSSTVGVLHVQKRFARALHEGVCGPNLVPVRNWTRDGSGPKWVEDKMIRFGNKYVAIAADGLFT
jgi:hypothetical protein